MTRLSLGLLAAAVSFPLFESATADPKVVGFDFRKEIRSLPATSSRLHRRQKTVQTAVSNEESLYLINVTIGTPPRSYDLQLDTGSSDIWIPSTNSNACQQNPQACQQLGGYDSSASSTYQLLAANSFQIQYVDGSAIQGDYISDTLEIGNTAVHNMTMGLASVADRPLGIMGVGYQAGESIAAKGPQNVYPNIINQLQTQGYINTLAYSLWLNDLDANTGSILFGGVDTAKYHGGLKALPVQPDAQSQSLTSFTVALSSVNVLDGSGHSQYSQSIDIPVILDSGTTITYLPDDIATAILQGVGATNTQNYGYVAPCSLGNTGASFSFGFGGPGGPVVNVSMAEMLLPLYDKNGVPVLDGPCVFGINPAGNSPNLFGDTFLRSAYVVYDLQNNQLALANTNFNATSSSIVEISGKTVPGASTTASAVQVTQTFSGYPLVTQSQGSNSGAVTALSATGTFNLGGAGGTHASATASSSSSSSSKAAASGPRVPAVETAVGVVGIVTAFCFAFGGSLLFLR